MARTHEPLRTILSAVAADGDGTTISVADYRHIVLEVATASSADATIKIAGSVSDTAPDFGAAQSVSNMFDYVECIDLEDGASIAGDTGISFGGTDDFRLLAVNTDNLRHLNVVVSSYVAGAITVKAYPANNS